MANLPESSSFDAGVYQLELTDPVIGGPSGISNAPLKNLANRTKYLKDHVDALESSRAPLASPALTGTPTAPTAANGTNTTQLATTAFVGAAITANAPDLSPYAPKASPTFTGNPVAPTPAQFDNDTSLATSAFVKQALGSFANMAAFNTNQTLTAAYVGHHIYFYGGSNGTFTLPALSGIPAGSAIMVSNVQAVNTLTVQASGSDSLLRPDATGGAITLKAGESATFTVAPNSGAWIAQGTGALGYSGSFVASLGSSGYQKLPSGLIIQWGQWNTTTGATTTVTFPIAFPNARIFGVVNASNGVNPRWGTPSCGVVTQSNMVIGLYSAFDYVLTAGGGTWFAVGY